ncbi:MAG: nucleotidyltransferase [Jatrophihabitans sp.]|uniref:nucleotidyltransferase n=1 Tax=Jatrophihabitans sp. TaxID=1932789 RepID=UPI00390D7D7B
MTDRHDQLRETLKRAASALKEHGPDFALGGGYALWAHGAPEPVHDVDLVVAEDDADPAAATLHEAGFQIERTPEDWLFKAHADGVFVDVLHRLNGTPVTGDTLSAVDELEVLGIRIPVLRATEVVTTKLQALSEHYCDFGALLPPIRAVREQLDWERIRRDNAEHDFAAAFLFLTDRLGISD